MPLLWLRMSITGDTEKDLRSFWEMVGSCGGGNQAGPVAAWGHPRNQTGSPKIRRTDVGEKIKSSHR